MTSLHLASFILRCINWLHWYITSEEELILDLLDIESSFCVTYDTASNKLMEVSLEAI